MFETPGSVTWQDTVAKAVASMEQRTGLQLADLSPAEITQRVKHWMKAKQDGTLKDEFPVQQQSSQDAI